MSFFGLYWSRLFGQAGPPIFGQGRPLHASRHVQVGFFPTIRWEKRRASKEKGHLADPTTLTASARQPLRAPDPPGNRSGPRHHPSLQEVGQAAAPADL